MSNGWNCKALEPVLVLALLKILLIHQVEYLHELQFGLNFYPLKWNQQGLANPKILLGI